MAISMICGGFAMEGAQALRILLALAMIEKLRMFSMGTALMAAQITSTSASGKRQAVPKPKPMRY
jgi:hypothetical protein